MRRAKIICTLGPASNTAEQIEALIRAGMNVARLNFSHGSHESHRKLYQTIRDTAARIGQPVAIMQDLQGPKIRVGKLPGGCITLVAGTQVELFHGESSTSETRIPCSYAAICQDVTVGGTILLNDGRLKLRIDDKTTTSVRCTVIDGGELRDKKGLNLPGTVLSTPALTEKDRADAGFGLELGVDLLALSFVRSERDVVQARELIGSTPLVAKIEKPEALNEFEAILDHVSGIMVARGDLGVEIGPERVPMIQKRLIEIANAHGKLVITATEMLDSMRDNSRPTRAEVSDVANAILDGSDALMLSGETASGKYPVASVRTMDRVIRETEDSEQYQSRVADAPVSLRGDTESSAIALAANAAAEEVDAAAIVCFTRSGAVALAASQFRPPVPLIAATLSQTLYRRLAAHWGVIPLHVPGPIDSVESAVNSITVAARDAGLVASGACVIFAAGSHENDASNMIKILKVP